MSGCKLKMYKKKNISFVLDSRRTSSSRCLSFHGKHFDEFNTKYRHWPGDVFWKQTVNPLQQQSCTAISVL